MRRSLIPFLLLLTGAGPSPSFTNGTFSGTIGVTGAATLSGGGTLTGSFAGGTFTGTTMTTPTINGGALTGTFTGVHTYSGATTLSGGGTLSGTFAGDPVFNNTSGADLQLRGQMDIGTGVGAGATTTIRTPNGSHIDIRPNGTAHVKIQGGSGPIDFGPAVQTSSMTGSLSAGSSVGFVQNAALSGTNGTVGAVGLNQWNVSSDVLNKTNSQFIFNTAINYNFGGGAYAGSRGGLLVNMVQVGAAPGSSSQGGMEGIQSSIALTASWGGTNLAAGALGGVTTLNGFLAATSGFTNGIGGSVAEFDIQMAAGSTFQQVSGLSIVLTTAHASAGAYGDAGLWIAAQVSNAAGLNDGILFGGSSGRPIAATGTLIESQYATTGGVSATIARGFDIQQSNITDVAFRSAGFSVDGQTGDIRTGTLFLNNTSTGGEVDASGSVGTAAAVAAGGSSFPTDGNQYYATDTNGGIYSLTINGSGVVTAVAIVNAPTVKGSTPANPVSLTANKRAAAWGATGLTVNLTWSARNLLKLNPSGTGNVQIGTGSALATNAVLGLPLFPTMAGAPTGTVGAAGQAAVVIDTTNKKLCFSTGGGAWECSAAFTP